MNQEINSAISEIDQFMKDRNRKAIIIVHTSRSKHFYCVNKESGQTIRISGDGNCFFRAVHEACKSQMPTELFNKLFNNESQQEKGALTLRRKMADFVRNNPTNYHVQRLNKEIFSCYV